MKRWIASSFVYMLLFNGAYLLHRAIFIFFPWFISAHIFNVPLYIPFSVSDSVMFVLFLVPYSEMKTIIETSKK